MLFYQPLRALYPFTPTFQPWSIQVPQPSTEQQDLLAKIGLPTGKNFTTERKEPRTDGRRRRRPDRRRGGATKHDDTGKAIGSVERRHGGAGGEKNGEARNC